jgi:hypothetical protein
MMAILSLRATLDSPPAPSCRKTYRRKPCWPSRPHRSKISWQYYNDIRTHRSLDKDALVSLPVQRIGSINSDAILGGLHHQYVRVRFWFSVHTTARRTMGRAKTVAGGATFRARMSGDLSRPALGPAGAAPMSRERRQDRKCFRPNVAARRAWSRVPRQTP